MSKVADDILSARPDWSHPIPEELERAWTWLESQGVYSLSTPDAYYVTTAPGERQVGPVFSGSESLDGWFEPGSEGYARLLPIAEISGSGSIGALWDDEGTLRFVALDSEGGAFTLADNARDVLALLAIGYDEFDRWSLVMAPDDDDAIAGVAAFRGWVESQGIAVPEKWHVADDRFTAWVAQQFE